MSVLCDCSCATECPLGRTGSSTRCTAEELRRAIRAHRAGLEDAQSAMRTMLKPRHLDPLDEAWLESAINAAAEVLAAQPQSRVAIKRDLEATSYAINLRETARVWGFESWEEFRALIAEGGHAVSVLNGPRNAVELPGGVTMSVEEWRSQRVKHG